MTKATLKTAEAVKKAPRAATKIPAKKNAALKGGESFSSLALESVCFPEFSIKRTLDSDGVAVLAEEERMGLHLNLTTRSHTSTKKNVAFCILAMEFSAKVHGAKGSICKVVIHTQGSFISTDEAVSAKNFASLVREDPEVQKRMVEQLYPFAMKHLTTLMMHSGLSDMSPTLALPSGFSPDPM